MSLGCDLDWVTCSTGTLKPSAAAQCPQDSPRESLLLLSRDCEWSRRTIVGQERIEANAVAFHSTATFLNDPSIHNSQWRHFWTFWRLFCFFQWEELPPVHCRKYFGTVDFVVCLFYICTKKHYIVNLIIFVFFKNIKNWYSFRTLFNFIISNRFK